MKWNLPPLNALRSFEAAARLSSFSAAADELAVTPGAISRQIAKLEEFLGANLFSRRSREVRLTQVGVEYLEMAGSAFQMIHRETGRLRKDNDSNTLTIWSSMTVSMRWLVPTLASYYARMQGTEVELTTSLHPLVGNSREFDFAVRYGHGDWPGFTSDLLFMTDLLPVCAPEMLSEFPTRTPADLIGKTLLHSHVRLGDWQAYWAAAELGELQMAGVQFEISAIAYQAAAQGMGVALGQHKLIEDDLASGRLVAPIDFSIPSNGGFYLIYLPETLRRKPATAFRRWLLDVAHSPKTKS